MNLASRNAAIELESRFRFRKAEPIETEAARFAAPAIFRKRSRVRTFRYEDVGGVAKIFSGVFRHPPSEGSTLLTADIKAIFLEHPLYRQGNSSLVYESHNGEISGFLGCMPVPFSCDGNLLAGNVLSTWMVRDRIEDPRAGAMLLKSHLQRPNDLTIVDTANARSLQFSKASKISVLPANSLQWFKPLNYSGYALSALSDKIRLVGTRTMLSAARNSENFIRNLFGPDQDDPFSEWRSHNVDLTTFSERYLFFTREFRLRPNWDRKVVEWMLTHAGRRADRGSLIFHEVIDNKGVSAGCFAYHKTPNGRALVLQALARRQAEEGVLRVLMATARGEGCVSVSGPSNPKILDGLFRIPGILYRHTCATAARSPRSDVMHLLGAGDGLVGGLIGDSWTPLASESYRV